ncbi:right-handed parallel beta-helix repeat-containing protein [Methylomonas sp. MED-D]|uniref:right-handed parallel beta-helix repeat-containing protein n=1 Tax=unclassified Methylomonas TaxID=2608980 RepID=UPI0028A4F3ED|nr:right-handed parallel beta-helix repeat-containing protein [Methylomonas sp. MV1]MDT4330067.1 right-handed parallel beta-helix repeat-containing protein [Methylomonas sp. MV1]
MKFPILSLTTTAFIVFITPAAALDYFVGQNGNDAWSGTRQFPNESGNDGPFKTLERAQQAIRTAKQSRGPDETIQVNIAGGTYYLDHSLLFNDTDSGTPNHEIVWQAQPGADTILSGGQAIQCKSGADNLWHCPFSKVPVKTDSIDSDRIQGNAPTFDVYVGDQRMTLARWPDQEWAHIKLPFDDKSSFSAMESLPPLGQDVYDAQLHIFPGNDWFDQYVGVETIDSTANTIKTASPAKYKLQSGRRFYLRNLRALLNMPGEWYFDRQAKEVILIPPEKAGANSTPGTAIVSVLPNLLIADHIANVSFKGLKFKHSDDTAVIVKNASNVLFDGVEISQTGSKGLEIKSGRRVTLANSKVHDTGTQGMVVSGGDKNLLQVSGHTIRNNQIGQTGQILLMNRPSIEINGVGNIVTNNLLEYGPSNAIILTGNDHLIEKNEIHDFCLQAADCGAIYTGRDWSARGNIIRNNYLHEVIGYGMKSVDIANNQAIYQSPNYSMGVYLDDGASGFDVSGNIFKNAGSVAIHIHGGRDNKIHDNLIVTNDSAIWVSQMVETFNWSENQKKLDTSPYKTAHWQQKYPELAAPMTNKIWPEGNRIERNVVVSSKSDGQIFRYWLPTMGTVIGNNIVWSTAGKVAVNYFFSEKGTKKSIINWQDWINLGVEKDSSIADPCVSIVGKQAVFCAESPAKRIGFQTIPADIGLIK